MPVIYFIVVLSATALVAFHASRCRLTLGTAAGWTLLVLLHGLVVKPAFVAANLPSEDILDFMLFQQIDRDEYWTRGLAMLPLYGVFLVAMFGTGAYGRRTARPPTSSVASRFRLSALAGLTLVALAGAVGFFAQFPQLLETGNKNSIATLDIAEYSGGGIWRAMVEVAYIVSLCALVNVGAGARAARSLAISLAAIGLWVTFCLLSDQRGAALFSIVAYLLAYSRFVGRLPRRAVVAVLIVVVSAIGLKTVSRLQAEVGVDDDLAYAGANLIGQNLVENSKTISIMKAVPARLDFQLGASYLDALRILVPRAIYPDKQTVNLDTLIGNQVYDCGAFGACGVPPGLIAESYLNFGIVGLLLMPALAGAAIGAMDLRFRLGRRSTGFDLFYLYAWIFSGMSILGSGISSSLTSLVTQMTTLGVVLLIARKVSPRRQLARLAAA